MKLPTFNKTRKVTKDLFRREVRYHLAEGWGVEEVAMAAGVDADTIRKMVADMRAKGELAGLVGETRLDAGPLRLGKDRDGYHGTNNVPDAKDPVNEP